MALLTAGLEGDAALQDRANFADILAHSTESTHVGYVRLVIASADLASLAPDNTNNWQSLDMADQTFIAPQANGGLGSWGKLVLGYRPDITGGTDSAIVPITYYDTNVTPNSADNIVVRWNAGGYARAV